MYLIGFQLGVAKREWKLARKTWGIMTIQKSKCMLHVSSNTVA